MSQYAFSLSLPAIFSEYNFFVSSCNHEAWQWVTTWPEWPAHALLMYGAPGCGKSHLGYIWANRAQASIVDASELAAEPKAGNWLIENIETLQHQEYLLHWFNFTRENKQSLLLTSSLPPAQLPFTLPDLTSRLLGTSYVSIQDADDDALKSVMRKQFSDRQIKVDEEVIAFLLPRMERSFAAAAAMVAKLDKAALAEQRTLTIPFVKRCLEN